MKLQDVLEMTMRASSYEKLGDALSQFVNFTDQETHVGDIEKYKVFKKRLKSIDRYVVFDDASPIAFFDINFRTAILVTAFVLADFRKTGIFSSFLFFLKRNEGYGKIILGDLHSNDTVNAVKRIHSRFKTYWQKGNQKVLYDLNTVDMFYSYSKPTGWSIVLENDGDFSSWPKYFEETNPKSFYFEALLDE